MKYVLFLLITTSSLKFLYSQDNCNSTKVYANKKQTEFDTRFNSIDKIKSSPKFKGGEKKLTKLIRENLKLSDVAKSQVFNLNFQFTITCDGEIVDVKQIGDQKMDNWTNISEVIQTTKGLWTPAKENGENVNCIYFQKIFINGSNYF